MSEQRYPLSWPEGWKRTAPSERRDAKFSRPSSRDSNNNYIAKRRLTVTEGVDRIPAQLRCMDVYSDGLLISTSVPSRLDGMPRGDRAWPRDPGAAVYWQAGGKRQCMAVDIYDRVADNLAAIAASLEALRAIERHGGAEILERASRGFAALPETASGKSWRVVLGFSPGEVPSPEMIRKKYRAVASRAHPDTGGTSEAFHDLQWAVKAALAEVGEGQT